MSIRDAISGRIKAPNAEKQKMLDDVLEAFDSNLPVKVMDAIEVLTMILATIVVISAHDREYAEKITESIVWNINDMIDREHPKSRKH